jgi:hypothetical protein
MAPLPPLRARQSLSKERFSAYFGALKTQTYHDPATSRGGGSHGYVRFISHRPCFISVYGLLVISMTYEHTIFLSN